jgi:hypothetical protein
MSKHTQGPWAATVEKDGYGLKIKSGDVFVVSGCGCCGSPWADNLHDVPLLGAAPDLLAALEKCAVQLEMIGLVLVHDERAALIDARAAIAKAKGEA